MYADVELLLMNALVMPRWGHEIHMHSVDPIMAIINLTSISKYMEDELASKIVYLTSLLVTMWFRSRPTYAITLVPCRSRFKTDEILAINHVFSLGLTKNYHPPSHVSSLCWAFQQRTINAGHWSTLIVTPFYIAKAYHCTYIIIIHTQFAVSVSDDVVCSVVICAFGRVSKRGCSRLASFDFHMFRRCYNVRLHDSLADDRFLKETSHVDGRT